MSTARKGFHYKRLVAAGVKMDRHYREYTTEELREADEIATRNGLLQPPTEAELAEVERRAHAPRPGAGRRAATPPAPPAPGSPDYPLQQGPLDDLPAFELPEQDYPQQERAAPPPPAAPPAAQIPQRPRDPEEMPGQRQNSKPLEEPIRVDEQGRVWLQEEVKKPAYPKPRGRRVLRYNDPGVKQETVVIGEYTETFEVAGDPRNAIPSQVKITLPSYQVGIYRDPRFPFKVITYDGRDGFDRIEVETFYGGAELVPPECKRVYVENVLCYDMRSVIRAIQTEYRQQQLAGRIQ